MPSRNDTRKQIALAARRLTATHGLTGFTLIDLSREACVSHTTIYNHFESKDHVVRTLADRWNTDCLDVAEAEAGQASDPVERLRRLMLTLCREKCRLCAEEPNLFAAYRSVLDTGTMARDAYLDRLVLLMTQILCEAGGDPAEAAAFADALLVATVKFRHAVFIDKHGFERLSQQLDHAFRHVFDPAVRSIVNGKPTF